MGEEKKTTVIVTLVVEEGAEPGEAADGAEPTEMSPLKPETTETDVNGTPSGATVGNGKDVEKDLDKNGLVAMLSQPKPRFIIVTAAVIAFAVIAIIATIIAVSMEVDQQWPVDRTPRMLLVIPTPKGPHNLIRYRSGHGDEGAVWPELTKELDAVYSKYSFETQVGKKHFRSCDSGPSPSDNLTCFFSTEKHKSLCSSLNNFGYPDGSPCVLLQVNYRQLFNWTPQVYTNEDLANNTDLPAALRATYRSTGPYIECKGNTIVDVENAGDIRYAPGHEFSVNHFPYKGHPDYMPPLIAVKFEKPATAITIGITCRVWAKNIGPQDIFDPTTNTTRHVPADRSLPSAELPFNLYVE